MIGIQGEDIVYLCVIFRELVFKPFLLSYEYRLCPDTDSAYRWCGSVPEELPHLMVMCCVLSDLWRCWGITSPRDLWLHPASSLSFLRDAGVIQDPQ